MIKKLFLLTSLFILNSQARENPFFPSQGEEDLPYTSNQSQKKPKLPRLSISLPSTARLIKKVTIEYENLDASYERRSIDLDNSIDWHLPIFISQSYASDKKLIKETQKINKTSSSYRQVGKIKGTKFLVFKNSLKIISKDIIIRNFLLAQPHRIVIDFKRDESIKSYVKNISNSIFSKIRIGNHDGYYRIVLELDGYYRYKLTKLDDFYVITLE